MKQITILGASAGVGLLTVKQALQNGNRVKTLSRQTNTLPNHPNLIPIQGSATVVSDVKKAIEGSDAIIVTLGTGTSTKATTLYSDAAHVLLKALQELQVNPPVLVLTGFGAGDSGPYNSFLMRLLFSLMLKDVYRDKTAMEQIITGAYANWEIVRPGRLTDTPLTENYQTFTELFKGIRIGATSRANVAHFLVEQAQHPTLLNQYVSLTN